MRCRRKLTKATLEGPWRCKLRTKPNLCASRNSLITSLWPRSRVIVLTAPPNKGKSTLGRRPSSLTTVSCARVYNGYVNCFELPKQYRYLFVSACEICDTLQLEDICIDCQEAIPDDENGLSGGHIIFELVILLCICVPICCLCYQKMEKGLWQRMIWTFEVERCSQSTTQTTCNESLVAWSKVFENLPWFKIWALGWATTTTTTTTTTLYGRQTVQT